MREIRSDYAVPAGQLVQVAITDAAGQALSVDSAFVTRMARCELVLASAIPASAAARTLLPGGGEVSVSLEGVVDFAREREKLSSELTGLQTQLDALRGRLSNEKFTAKAPAAIVEAERAKEREWSLRADQLAAKLRSLGGA